MITWHSIVKNDNVDSIVKNDNVEQYCEEW